MRRHVIIDYRHARIVGHDDGLIFLDDEELGVGLIDGRALPVHQGADQKTQRRAEDDEGLALPKDGEEPARDACGIDFELFAGRRFSDFRVGAGVDPPITPAGAVIDPNGNCVRRSDEIWSGLGKNSVACTKFLLCVGRACSMVRLSEFAKLPWPGRTPVSL